MDATNACFLYFFQFRFFFSYSIQNANVFLFTTRKNRTDVSASLLTSYSCPVCPLKQDVWGTHLERMLHLTLCSQPPLTALPFPDALKRKHRLYLIQFAQDCYH